MSREEIQLAAVLSERFQQPAIDLALAAYSSVAHARDWSVGHKLDLYREGRRAFLPDRPIHARREAFATIYAALKRYWQVFRPRGPGPRGDPTQLFDLLADFAPMFGPESARTLGNIDSADCGDLQSFFWALRDIKEMHSFPTMAVSKFAHFFNPSLFPIYDTEVIWNQVFRVHGRECDAFCRSAGRPLRAVGDVWLVNYVLWASSLVQGATAQGGQRAFESWLGTEAPEHPLLRDSVGGRLDLSAALFEFVAIGSAALALETDPAQRHSEPA